MSVPVHGADLVAEWIAQIGEIESDRTALAPAGGILDALSAAGYARVVEGFDFVSAVAGESYCAPLARVAALPSIGFDMPKVPVGLR